MSPNYTGKTILIVGAARSGIAAAKFLLAGGARVILTDSQTEETLTPALQGLRDAHAPIGTLQFELGGHKPETFRRCDLVVVSPGIPLTLPCFRESRDAGVPVIGEVELAWRHLRGKIIGITGSNGKTTTTALVRALLSGAGFKAYAAGNIGTPLISLADQSMPEDILVAELSSFQLEAIHGFRPAIGAILNITPDHMDRYPGFEEYAAAKKRLFMNQQRTDYAVLNADDPQTSGMAGQVPSTPFLFSRREPPLHGSFVREGQIWFRDGDREFLIFPIGAIRLRGTHNLENTLAACTIALLAGAPPESLHQGICDFAGVEHRIEFVAEVGGIRYFNDSKATNVDATIKSLEAFDGNIILIAGGRDKGSDFSPLLPLVTNRVKHLLLIGEAARKMRAVLSGAAPLSEADSLAEAVGIAAQLAQPGDTVLLAPACASFDMFRNYEHRGQVFKEAVHALKQLMK